MEAKPQFFILWLPPEWNVIIKKISDEMYLVQPYASEN